MQRSRRLTATGTLLVGLSIALVGASFFAAGKISPDSQAFDYVRVISYLVLGAVLTYYFQRWLTVGLNCTGDLAVFLTVMFTAFFLIGTIAAVSQKNESRIFILPLTAAAICFSLLDFTRKRMDVKSETVKGGTVAVVQRSGFFDRFEDPGTIFLTGNNEEVAYTLSTADQTRTIRTSVLHMGALAYGYVFRVHYRLAPRSLVDPDDNKLEHLKSVPDVLETIREAVQAAVEQAEQTYDAGAPETYRNDWFGSLLRIRPDTPMRRTFLNAVNLEVAEKLQPKGIKWDSQRELSVEALQLPQDLITALTRPEYDRLLKLHTANMDAASSARLYTWIVRAEPLDIPFSIDTTTPPLHRGAAQGPAPAATENVRPKPVKITKPTLTPEDLSIMKKIPG